MAQWSRAQNQWMAPRSTQFHSPEVNRMSTRDFWYLVVKSKLPPRSGTTPEAVEPRLFFKMTATVLEPTTT